MSIVTSESDDSSILGSSHILFKRREPSILIQRLALRYQCLAYDRTQGLRDPSMPCNLQLFDEVSEIGTNGLSFGWDICGWDAWQRYPSISRNASNDDHSCLDSKGGIFLKLGNTCSLIN